MAEQERCPTCGFWTSAGKRMLAQKAKECPIFGTDFSKSLSEIIEGVRRRLVAARGTLEDIHFAYPGLGEQTENVAGLLTCGLIALHGIAEQMREAERRATEQGRAGEDKP